MLTRYNKLDNEPITQHFAVDDEVVLFDGEEELSQKTEYYISHHAERERIAENGYQKCIQDFSYRSNAAIIIDDFKSLHDA